LFGQFLGNQPVDKSTDGSGHSINDAARFHEANQEVARSFYTRSLFGEDIDRSVQIRGLCKLIDRKCFTVQMHACPLCADVHTILG
jgi:hypothetical protein